MKVSPISLAQSESLPIGVVQDAVVSQQVDHPGGQGFESGKPLPEVRQKPDEDLDGGLVSVLLEPTRVADLAVGLEV